MSTIKISDLNSAGSELFSDSESYMNELANDELNATYGGSSIVCVSASITVSLISVNVASPLIVATPGPGPVAPGRSRAF